MKERQPLSELEIRAFEKRIRRLESDRPREGEGPCGWRHLTHWLQKQAELDSWMVSLEGDHRRYEFRLAGLWYIFTLNYDVNARGRREFSGEWIHPTKRYFEIADRPEGWMRLLPIEKLCVLKIVDDLTMNGSAGHFDGIVSIKQFGEEAPRVSVTVWTD